MPHLSAPGTSGAAIPASTGPLPAEETAARVRQYILDTMLLGITDGFDDQTSLLDAGILDSTGAMELVAFLEQTFGLVVEDHEIIPDNLDSVARIAALIRRKQPHPATPT